MFLGWIQTILTPETIQPLAIAGRSAKTVGIALGLLNAANQHCHITKAIFGIDLFFRHSSLNPARLQVAPRVLPE